MARVSTYLNFMGNTEEAFDFYRSVFKTEYLAPITRMGEMPQAPGMPELSASEKHKVRLARQDVACAPEVFEELPPRLRALILTSIRLQARLIHLDRSLFDGQPRENASGPSPIAHQMERLRTAFAAH